MASLTFDRRIREIGFEIEEGRPRNVAREILLAPTRRVSQLPATVNELVSHASIVSLGQQRSRATHFRRHVFLLRQAVANAHLLFFVVDV